MSETDHPPPGAAQRVFRALDTALSAVEKLIMAIVVVVLFLIMIFVAADALLRYTLNSPLIFSYDLVSMYLLPVAMLIPASFVLRRGGHISVDLFALMMPARMQQLLFGISTLACAPVFTIMFYRIMQSSLESYEHGLVTTGMINWPIWLHQAIFSVTTFAVAVRLVHIGITNLFAFVTGADKIAISVLPDHSDPLEEAV
ncbi:TRAP transporter small permease [Salipiger abyssi]|uniref:TRAP transporter small permease n=1 Tax=Salipiger abyssi TaxID=1250539 RepID=UPI001A8D3649|nr:TRAP transporter small permease [Salipiger abyssi]MBN9889318.1 TRAP transporter small permease [Salipiger abyssi]